LDPHSDAPITLAQAGIGKHLADRARKLAALPEELFDAGLKRVRDRISAGKRVSLDITAIDKKTRRADRERVLGEGQSLAQSKCELLGWSICWAVYESVVPDRRCPSRLRRGEIPHVPLTRFEQPRRFCDQRPSFSRLVDCSFSDRF
jgi:hypothetical protein